MERGPAGRAGYWSLGGPRDVQAVYDEMRRSLQRHGSLPAPSPATLAVADALLSARRPR